MPDLPELLCPAGTMEALDAALHFGADAVYGGMKRFGLRAFAGNFDEAQLAQAVDKTHRLGRRFYLTMNVFPFDDQLEDFVAAARRAQEIGVDAAIVSDLGAIVTLRQRVPGLPLHVSTQASAVNAAAVEHYRQLGCERVILARETSIARMAAIHEAVPEMEIETFVHGASCVAWSGRCLLSAALTLGTGAALLLPHARKAAEPELSEMFGVKVRLELWVKVEPNWVKNDRLLTEMGYKGSLV